MQDTTQRFSTRVDNYVKYRPSYPPGVIETLREQCGLTEGSVVADIGSGTGILAEMFLRNGNTVYGVEPNHEMREAGERLLVSYPNFHSVDARAEATGLPDASADFVTAGQAFHWFDPQTAKTEFARILKPEGWCVLIWNVRRMASTPFLQAYEALLQRYGTDYDTARHRDMDKHSFDDLFAQGRPKLVKFENIQLFNYVSLEGRLLSSSYTPQPGNPNYQPMLAELRRIFDQYNENGQVTFEYDTEMYYGRVSRS